MAEHLHAFTCTSCKALLVWRELVSGKRAPCEIDPVFIRVDAEGATQGFNDAGAHVRGNAVAQGTEDAVRCWLSHHARCPNADAHRRGKKARQATPATTPSAKASAAPRPGGAQPCRKCGASITFQHLTDGKAVAVEVERVCVLLPRAGQPAPEGERVHVVWRGAVRQGVAVERGTPHSCVAPLYHRARCKPQHGTPRAPTQEPKP